MPFDPKLIRDDDANFEGDLQLPDDLALMAQQLGDDAARLAATYPPPMPVVLADARQVAPRRKNAWLMRSLAGTALAVGLVTISVVALNTQQPPDANLATPKIVDRSPPAGSLVVHESPVTRSNPPTVPVTPASWLGDTSGPELEALMDLWEKDQPAVRSLSF
ncbi:MAG: hypothetical protein ACKVP0_08600 [Pirellulaceae bacterium]